jgi:hypothetical protein
MAGLLTRPRVRSVVATSPSLALGLARELGTASGEAQALAGLARCALAEGRTAEAEAGLRQALALLQEIGAAEAAADVSAELDALHDTPDPASTSP